MTSVHICCFCNLGNSKSLFLKKSFNFSFELRKPIASVAATMMINIFWAEKTFKKFPSLLIFYEMSSTNRVNFLSSGKNLFPALTSPLSLSLYVIHFKRIASHQSVLTKRNICQRITQNQKGGDNPTKLSDSCFRLASMSSNKTFVVKLTLAGLQKLQHLVKF